jgi:hypothetical protein
LRGRITSRGIVVEILNGQSTSAKTVVRPARLRGGFAYPFVAGAGLVFVCSALINRHPLRSTAC